MSDEQISSAPEADAATPVPESPPAAQPRAPDGTFSSTPEAPKADATTEPQEGDTPEEPEQKDEPKRNRVQERIDQLTAARNAERRRADMLAQQLAKLQAPSQRQVDPDDWDAQQAEKFRSVVREEQSESTAAELQAARARAAEIQYETFQAKIEGARERIPDMDQAMSVFLDPRFPVSPAMAEIITESERTAEIAHYLARNPGEAAAIANAPEWRQGYMLKDIETKVSLPTRRTSKAPPPHPTVTAAQTPRERQPAEMSASEYVAWRKAQWAGKG